jgi:hypothetical protein
MSASLPQARDSQTPERLPSALSVGGSRNSLNPHPMLTSTSNFIPGYLSGLTGLNGT